MAKARQRQRKPAAGVECCRLRFTGPDGLVRTLGVGDRDDTHRVVQRIVLEDCVGYVRFTNGEEDVYVNTPLVGTCPKKRRLGETE